MFLIASVVVGLAAGLIRAWVAHRPLRGYDIRLSWLLFVAFFPQLIAFVLPTKTWFPDELAPLALVTSQIGLLIFAILNLKLPGFWLLTIGLVLNLTVISLNGGLMPISPEVAYTMFPDAPKEAMVVGERLGTGKDILLTIQQTRCWFLSDRFLFSYWPGLYVSFSLGDAFIVAGIVLGLWGIGAPVKTVLPAAQTLASGD